MSQQAVLQSAARDGSDTYRLGAINLVSLRHAGIVELTGFLDPALHRHFGLPETMNFG